MPKADSTLDTYEFHAPEPGTLLSTSEGFEFQLPESGDVRALALYDSCPVNKFELEESALWVKYLGAGERTVNVVEAVGDLRAEGEWSRGEIPPGTSFCAVALVIEAQNVVSVSHGVPFLVGEPQVPGEPCENVLDACPSNDEPLVCMNGVCEVLCLSDLDCERVGGNCHDPFRGVRVCR